MQVRGRGIKGLDLGAGCGIGLGYGFGIGLMLRPDVLEGMSRALQHQFGTLCTIFWDRAHVARLAVLEGDEAGVPTPRPPPATKN